MCALPILPAMESLDIRPDSCLTVDGVEYALAGSGSSKQLAVLAPQGSSLPGGFTGQLSQAAAGQLLLGPLSPQNAAALRQRLPWLKAVPLGLQTSFGFGDRLGLATPGHVQSVRGTGLDPIFAQQSVRENARTRRTPQQVMDDALWGVFQEGWRLAWGADADHVKQIDDLAAFTAAGYTFFTVDPGDHVDNAAQQDALPALKTKVAALDWQALESSAEESYRSYAWKTFELEGLTLSFDEATLLRAAAKYGPAVVHALRIYRRLEALKAGEAFDFEVSVDETDLPTSVHEHYWIASELKRLGVRWNSLAPRLPGRFEKGVDYIGDLNLLEAELARHAAVMQHFGNYKLSLHSGSDKLSVYPMFSHLTQGRAHVKTAGTSYLEALRVIAAKDPPFFRELMVFCVQRYPADRATYHVSADLAKVPATESLADGDLPSLLDQFDARQVLHVTYGSVLDQYGDRLQSRLQADEAAYTRGLAQHFARHVAPFAQSSA